MMTPYYHPDDTSPYRAAPTESTACRAEHHELCELAGCPCGCHSKPADSGRKDER